MTYLLLLLFAMQLIGFYFMREINTYFIGQLSTNLNTQAGLLADLLNRSFTDQGNPVPDDATTDMDNLAATFAQLTGGQIYILNKNAVILSTSSSKTLVGQKRVQSQVIHALASGTNDTPQLVDFGTGGRYMVLAVPIRNQEQVVGVVDLEVPMKGIYQTIYKIYWIFFSGTFLALGLTAFLGIVIARAITGPVIEITKKAKEMAKGDFNQKVTVRSDDEIGQLGEAFNYMQDRLKEALAENEEEKDKITAILLHMSDGVIAANHAGEIIVVNPAAETMLGKKKEELLGTQLTDCIDLTDATSNQSILQTKGSSNFILSGHGGRTLQAYHTVFRDKDKDRVHTGSILVLHDVTELESQEQARREFVANVSHEIRTPLTTISSYLEALMDGALYDHSTSFRFLQVIENETKRMVRLVNDLLQLSRLEANKIKWNFQEHNLLDILDGVRDRFHLELIRQRISLQLEGVHANVTVYADRDKIDQVFDNLITNALKYTSQNGSITVQTIEEPEQVVIRVIDTGIGIPKEDLPKIFDRFYRVDKARSRKMGGTGLGLSIAQQMLEAHGGTITIDSEVGQGTVVTFTLPRKGGQAGCGNELKQAF
jgi:two-component system, OmpR family, sensor histidine kinase VicK